MQFNEDRNDLGARVEAAITVARRAGQDAAAFRARGLSHDLHVESKGLQDFVTIADRTAEKMIRDALMGAFPLDSFIGEEGGGYSGRQGTWVVDPIDGTTNYIRGLRHWGVSIAFVVGGEIEIGVIYDATQDAVFHALRGQGAYKNGLPISVAPTTDPESAMAILGYSRRTAFDDYLAVLKQLHDRGIDHRRMGAAAIGLVRVAEGVADLYYERHLNAWDILAGIRIAQEAGASIWTPPLSRLLADGGFVAASAPGLSETFAFLRPTESIAASSA